MRPALTNCPDDPHDTSGTWHPSAAPADRCRERAGLALLLAALATVACGGGPSVGDPAGTETKAPETSRPDCRSRPDDRRSRPGPAWPSRPRVVVLGDSLTAGYGLPSKDLAFPALLQKDIDAAGLEFEVVNMGVSGDTTAGGLRRLDWAMEGDVRVLVVALGGNDGLRGLGPAQMQENLTAIIDRARARGAQVLLCGMEAPPNLGAKYTDEFRAAYRRLAKSKGVALVPFMLDGVAGVPAVQPAGWHPPERGRGEARGRARLDRASSHARGQVDLMIELHGVSKTVSSGGRPLTILHPLDLSIRDGQTLAILGPSGSGKSTLLGLMAGLDAPTSGRIFIDGTDITGLGEDALAKLRGSKVGFVFQFFHLIGALTALENVLVPMELAGTRSAAARAAGAARRGRARRPWAPLPVPAVRRRAAAGRDCARTGERASRAPRRRADGQPRLRHGPAHRGHPVRREPQAQHDAGAGHARRGARQPGRQPHRAARRARGRSAGGRRARAVPGDRCSEPWDSSFAWWAGRPARPGDGWSSSSSASRSASARSSRCAPSSSPCVWRSWPRRRRSRPPTSW